jgi:hypothetical protein
MTAGIFASRFSLNSNHFAGKDSVKKSRPKARLRVK